jgi:MATE family multidrug resistance protein
VSALGAAARQRPVRVTHASVLRLALPMTLAHMSTPLLGFADTAVIGRLGQASLLGAIATCAVIFDFTFWPLGFLRLGTSGLVAQATGAGAGEEERATVLRALILAAFLAAALVALQRPIAWIAFTAMDASPEVTAAARSYFDIRIWAAPFTLVNYVVLGTVTGRGRTDIGLVLQVLINLVNIVFNVTLVMGLGLGVRGSALGTLAAEGLGCLVGLLVLYHLYGPRFAVPWRLLRDRARLARMVGVNRDIMIRSAALIFAFAFFTAQGARGGDLVLAANAVLMNLFLITAYFLDGFATAAEQMCGQSVGAGDPSGFRRAVRLTTFWCLILSTVATALAFFGGGAFIDLVSTDPAVRHLARLYLPFAALTPVLGALAFEFDGVFIGATWTSDMRNLMLVALGLYLALFLALRSFGNTGLWLALLGFLAARGGLQAWRYGWLASRTFLDPEQSPPMHPVAGLGVPDDG